jgi:hypothetical protein
MKSFTFNFKPYWIVFNFFYFTYVLGQNSRKNDLPSRGSQ